MKTNQKSLNPALFSPPTSFGSRVMEMDVLFVLVWGKNIFYTEEVTGLCELCFWRVQKRALLKWSPHCLTLSRTGLAANEANSVPGQVSLLSAKSSSITPVDHVIDTNLWLHAKSGNFWDLISILHDSPALMRRADQVSFLWRKCLSVDLEQCALGQHQLSIVKLLTSEEHN